MSKRQVAVMVDAGYFFKQGMEVLFGAGKSREETCLLEALAAKLFAAKAKEIFGREALRVYWYDAPPIKDEPSVSQRRLALCEGVKMRMGTLNGCGQQKGVDGMIISDMTTLARNGAVDGILLVSGDEDLRLAMEEAQSYGVKVMILGVGEEGNASVSGSMAACSDGVRRLSKEEARSVLRWTQRPQASQAISAPVSAPQSPSAKSKGSAKKAQAMAPRRNQGRVQEAPSAPSLSDASAMPLASPVDASRHAMPSFERSGAPAASASARGSRQEPSRRNAPHASIHASSSFGPATDAAARESAKFERSDHEAKTPRSEQDANEAKRKNRRGSRPSRHQKQAQREHQQRAHEQRVKSESSSSEALEESTALPLDRQAAEPFAAPRAAEPTVSGARVLPVAEVALERSKLSVAQPVAAVATSSEMGTTGSEQTVAVKAPRKAPARKPRAQPVAERIEASGGAFKAQTGMLAAMGETPGQPAEPIKPARKRAAKSAPKKQG